MIVTPSCHDKPMSTSTSLFTGLAAGVLLGALVGFLWARVRQQSGALEITTLQQQLLAKDAQMTNDANTIKTLNEQLATMRTEASQSTRLDEALNAVRANVSALTVQAQEAEIKRASGEASIKTQMESMRLGNENLLRETTKLAGALSNSQTRGKYGETQLEMLLESSGLKEGIHFFKQDYRSKDAEISKPDIKIAIPGGSEIFIDSKFPFTRFLEAVGEKDPDARADLMKLHAKDLMGHVNALAKRGYSESPLSPDYVVLFAPFESILSEALESDPQILNAAFEKGITIATPTTMMALLRTVAFVFSQSDMAHNAATIKELAGELIKRIGKVHNKIAKLGSSIKSSERAFNDLVQSAESNMLRPARKMIGLGVPTGNAKLKALEGVDDELRAIKITPEFSAEDLYDEDLELDEIVENGDHDD